VHRLRHKEMAKRLARRPVVVQLEHLPDREPLPPPALVKELARLKSDVCLRKDKEHRTLPACPPRTESQRSPDLKRKAT
jgi:hypothetical protein